MNAPSNLVLRTITGSIFVVVILTSMLHFWSFFVAMAVLLAASIYEYIKLIKEKRQPAQIVKFSYSPLIYFYIILPFVCLILLYLKSPVYALVVFVFVWVHDTFSYLTGLKFGKTKLYERISPKKTWEGFFGGLTASIITGFAFGCFAVDDITIIKWIGLAIVVVVAGTIGDLLESAFKRRLEVKDSGTLLPGHGGFLDRLDSVLLAAPAAAVYLLITN